MVLNSATAGLQEEAQNPAARRIDQDDDGDRALGTLRRGARGVAVPLTWRSFGPISRVKLGIEVYTANSVKSTSYAGFAVVVGDDVPIVPSQHGR
jgi:hypothetical protein